MKDHFLCIWKDFVFCKLVWGPSGGMSFSQNIFFFRNLVQGKVRGWYEILLFTRNTSFILHHSLWEKFGRAEIILNHIFSKVTMKKSESDWVDQRIFSKWTWGLELLVCGDVQQDLQFHLPSIASFSSAHKLPNKSCYFSHSTSTLLDVLGKIYELNLPKIHPL